MDKKCPFCNPEEKLVLWDKGMKHSLVVYESEYCLVAINLNPVNNCHLIVIPKKHYSKVKYFNDLAWEDLGLLIKSTIEKLCNFKKYKILYCFANQGKIAGQSLEHFHFHIVLQKSDDGFKAISIPDESVIDCDIVMDAGEKMSKVFYFEKDKWSLLWFQLKEMIINMEETCNPDGLNIFFSQESEIKVEGLKIRAISRKANDGILNYRRGKDKDDDRCRNTKFSLREIYEIKKIINPLSFH